MSTRREFLKTSLVAVGSALASPYLFASGPVPHIAFPTAPRERIAIASYPFRDFIAVPPGEQAKGNQPRMDLKEFPAHVVSKFNVNKVELWTGHFPSTEGAYLSDMRDALKRAKAMVVDIAVDGEHSPYSPDPAVRAKAVAFSKKWVDVASAIGAPSIRTNLPDANGAAPDLALMAASLSQVAQYAASKNVVVHLENDNPVSEDPFFLVNLVEKVNSPWLHTLPDFANTLATNKDPRHAYDGVNAMFAHAYGICHVKETENAPDGKPVHVDMARTFGYLKQHGFKGYCSMEYDSPGDPYAGTSALIEQTLKYLA